MGLTLGLSTALSGLLTSQKGLDVISQNVVNVNTPGYVRKVMTPESVAVDGSGAGVQAGNISRTVDEGLMSDIRRQTSTQGTLDTLQTYYPRVEELFGQVGDTTSIAHQVQTLQTSFETLSGQVNSPPLQTAVVQTSLDTANQLSQMTTALQNLRLEADRGIQDAVSQVNDQLANIYDLNQKIVRGTAIGSDVGDLQDKRDTALTTLSKYMNVQYFNRGEASNVAHDHGLGAAGRHQGFDPASVLELRFDQDILGLPTFLPDLPPHDLALNHVEPHGQVLGPGSMPGFLPPGRDRLFSVKVQGGRVDPVPGLNLDFLVAKQDDLGDALAAHQRQEHTPTGEPERFADLPAPLRELRLLVQPREVRAGLELPLLEFLEGRIHRPFQSLDLLSVIDRADLQADPLGDQYLCGCRRHGRPSLESTRRILSPAEILHSESSGATSAAVTSCGGEMDLSPESFVSSIRTTRF